MLLKTPDFKFQSAVIIQDEWQICMVNDDTQNRRLIEYQQQILIKGLIPYIINTILRIIK
jgi:hypothetical protein